MPRRHRSISGRSGTRSTVKAAANGQFLSVSGGSSRGIRQAAAAGIIVALTVLAYVPAIRGGFIWDDDTFLTKTPLIRASDGLYLFWFTTQAPDYFPLTSTLLWFEWRLWGMNAAGYHAVNVLLHAVSAVLIWRALRRLRIPAAWLAAMIFAVHPVNVESAAWITECKNVLPMVFYVLTVLWYLRFQEDRRARWYVLSIGSFLLALLAKTSVVTTPFVLLLCVWWLRGKVARRDLIHSLPFFLLGGALALVTMWFQENRAIGATLVRDDGFASRLAIAARAIWFYLYKGLLPRNLSFVYPRWTVNPIDPRSWIPLLLLVGAFTVLWRYRNDWARSALFALGYYVIMLFPVLGFFNIYFMRFSLVADHWQYFSIIGIIALGVGAAHSACARWFGNPRPVGAVLAAGVVGALSVLTWRQASIYRDVETLWRDTLSKNPDCFMAHCNLGTILVGQGKVDEGTDHCRRAVRIKPDYVEGLYNLGVVLDMQGKLDQAIAHYEEALRLCPDFAKAHNNLGYALAKRGDADGALAHFTEALRLAPDFAEAYVNIGVLLANQGKLDPAIARYKEALRINPNLAEAHHRLGLVMAAQGLVDQAVAHYQEALRIRPDHADAHKRLAIALAAQGKMDQAIVHFSQAVRLQPAHAQAHYDLAEALYRQGRLDQAIAEYQETLHVDPTHAKAHNNLGILLAGQGKIDESIAHYSQAVRI